jgi:hypothetical protein
MLPMQQEQAQPALQRQGPGQPQEQAQPALEVQQG